MHHYYIRAFEPPVYAAPPAPRLSPRCRHGTAATRSGQRVRTFPFSCWWSFAVPLRKGLGKLGYQRMSGNRAGGELQRVDYRLHRRSNQTVPGPRRLGLGFDGRRFR